MRVLLLLLLWRAQDKFRSPDLTSSKFYAGAAAGALAFGLRRRNLNSALYGAVVCGVLAALPDL